MRRLVLALVLCAAPGSPAEAGTWALEAYLGGAWNVPMPLVIRQGGHDDLSLTARWRSESFRPPLYYVVRVASWQGDRAWAMDLAHHKLYLENPPAEVSSFSVSHGYNLLTLQRLLERRRWRYGAGAGIVITHPESEVRGRRFDEHQGLFGGGYYVSGPTVGGLTARTQGLGGGLYLTAELRVTLSYAGVPVASGSARVPNLALHATVGLGWAEPR